MRVIATAGHVDHGKSTLVRALSGMEPDRWAEERRRGMTIDLGYAWTELNGDLLAFVDVPGHQRFIGNMLAGLGPAPAVLFVVAADEGWRRQSQEHLDAIDALGLTHGLLAVTRSDLADPAPALDEARDRIATSRLGVIDSVSVSGATGAGLDDLRDALGRLIARLPQPVTDGPVRLWVDRAFTIAGSGTVVTATLESGSVRVGDELELRGSRYRVRGLQQAGRAVDHAAAVSRVAVNLGGLARDQVGRGDALRTPGAWRDTVVIDVRLSRDLDPAPTGDAALAVKAGLAGQAALPGVAVLHVGTAAVPVRTRSLDPRWARLRLADALPLAPGDRAILRDPGDRSVIGLTVVDTAPPDFTRRGAARHRVQALEQGTDVRARLARTGFVRADELTPRAAAGDTGSHTAPRDTAPMDVAGALRVGAWLVSHDQWLAWQEDLRQVADAHAAADPLDPGITGESARRLVGLPDVGLVGDLVAAAGLVVVKGRITRPGVAPTLGPAEAAVAQLESRLRDRPFDAPERSELDQLRLGVRELAVAEATGRLLKLGADVYLLPSAPALAMHSLSSLQRTFTLSQARQALDTTRRVAVPLLEHLDARGWTERIDPVHRTIRR